MANTRGSRQAAVSGTTGIKRRHEPPRIVGDLLSAEIAEKQARSIKYQLTIAKLPLAKDIDDFDFTGTPVNEALIRGLASGAFLAEQRHTNRRRSDFSFGPICARKSAGITTDLSLFYRMRRVASGRAGTEGK